MNGAWKPLSAMCAIWDGRCVLTTHARAVASALVRRTDKKGECYPSFDTLSADTGLARRTVANAISELEAATAKGSSPVLLHVVRRCRPYGRGRAPNVYQLHLNLSAPQKLSSQDQSAQGELKSSPTSGDLSAQNAGPECTTRPDLSAPGSLDLTRGSDQVTDQRGPRVGSRSKSKRRKPEITIPDDFAPNDTGYAFGARLGFDRARVDAEAVKMRLDAEKNDKRWRDWQAALRSWLTRGKEFEVRDAARGAGPSRNGAPLKQAGPTADEYDWRRKETSQ